MQIIATISHSDKRFLQYLKFCRYFRSLRRKCFLRGNRFCVKRLQLTRDSFSLELSRRLKIILAAIQVHRASSRLTSGTKSQELVIRRCNRTSSSRHGFRGFPRHDSSRDARKIDLTIALHRALLRRFLREKPFLSSQVKM